MATWAEQETALSMLQHLLLGTELHLYQPSEYCMVYWWVVGQGIGTQLRRRRCRWLVFSCCMLLRWARTALGMHTLLQRPQASDALAELAVR
jgi:hypothetical protein